MFSIASHRKILRSKSEICHKLVNEVAIKADMTTTMSMTKMVTYYRVAFLIGFPRTALLLIQGEGATGGCNI